MSVVLPFSPPGRVAVVVEGVDEPNLLTTLAREVRGMFRHFVGRWSVTVRPVDRGRWRLELSGASGRHLWVFAAPVSRLSEVVVEKLDDFLRCSPVALRPTTR